MDSDETPTVLMGTCPDPQCQKRLSFFNQFSNVECPNCGQTHRKEALKNVKTLDNPDLLQSLVELLAQNIPAKLAAKKGPDTIKVNGLSNYHCKILSQFLTRYGMDRNGAPKLLTELERPETFDCSILGSRAFLLDPKHLNVPGFGKDSSGSLIYLHETLNRIYEFNKGRECLVPIHADGDGHCLVHAISRAIVGRELFWHPLRENLRRHFLENQSKYKILFEDFIDADEWNLIIQECQPDYVPPNGEPLGMRNIHIFGLANVLHRPIVLLDSLAGIQSLGDYTGVFLPCLVPVDQCRGPDKSLNKPLCIAWSSPGRNHYIPLVAVKEEEQCLPCLPRSLLPQVWGVDKCMMDQYLEFDERGSCIIGGDKSLKDSYIQRLASCMDRVFAATYGVTAGDVADVYHFIHKRTAIDSSTPDQIIDFTRRTLLDHRLYRCLNCEAVSEYSIDREQFERGGFLYGVAVRDHGALQQGNRYVFGPPSGVTCDYDEKADSLVPDWFNSQMSYCPFCESPSVRRIEQDGSLDYQNGDKTRTPAEKTTCPCGFKHWWNGKEYDNPPKVLPVILEWSNQIVKDEILWWDGESDASLNSNVYTSAQLMVQKHFPGEFGSERLVQRVVDSIIAQTQLASTDVDEPKCSGDSSNAWQSDQSSKIILVGPKKKTFHREELTMSKTEREIRSRAEQNARLMQKKRTIEMKTTKTSEKPASAASTAGKSEPVPPTSQKADSSDDRTKKTPTTTSERKVKVQTSDGKLGQLTLLPNTTMDQLQSLIESQFAIPSSRQRIRYGFPPKELDFACWPLPIQHGDKLLVEELKAKPETKAPPSLPSFDSLADVSPQGSIADWIAITLQRLSTDNKPLTDANLEKLILALNERIKGSDLESVHEAYLSLEVTAQTVASHLDLWRVVQRQSRLFEPDGLFYRHGTRDLPVAHGFEFSMPSLLRGKRFRYNGDQQRFEVYVDPFGFYPIEPNVDELVTINEWRSESTPINSWSEGAQIFQGQGRTLQSQREDRSADYLPTWPAADSTSNWNNWTDWASKGRGRTLRESAEAPRDKSRDISYLMKHSGPVDGQANVRRVGPGYSIIEQARTENTTNDQAERMNRILGDVMSLLKNTYGDEDQEMQEVATETKSKLNEGASRDLARGADSAGEDDDMDSDGGYS